VSEKCTACVFCRLSEDRHSMFFQNRSISDELVSVLMDTISVVFGLKLCHEWKGGWGLVWHCCFGSMISQIHSIVIEIFFSF
jgi:hypothetical protein